ncbi:DgyrCDS4985 [Dimorphilus gyrociliatus]|uniref:DgyrCDS4985 n=1 Tax=Dimorphilus gyrociliatus TaxID=2664684 RepID=A0A7I8VIL3_9ANNE|nr:DgyrCDS4985 [Dimorphilus gyrociliatus]
MSLGSKVALAGSIVFTTGIITYVHNKQKQDIERLHDGVIKDAERQEMRKIANLKHLQEQIDLTKALKAQRDKEMKTES